MGKVISFFENSKGVSIALSLFLLVALLTLSYCAGQRDGKSEARLVFERAQSEVLKEAINANEALAGEQLDDAARQAIEREELNYACDDTDDFDCRVRRGCFILRQQGTDTSGIAACVRAGVGARTGVPGGGPD